MRRILQINDGEKERERENLAMFHLLFVYLIKKNKEKRKNGKEVDNKSFPLDKHDLVFLCSLYSF